MRRPNQVSVTLPPEVLAEIDAAVAAGEFLNRSDAIATEMEAWYRRHREACAACDKPTDDTWQPWHRKRRLCPACTTHYKTLIADGPP